MTVYYMIFPYVNWCHFKYTEGNTFWTANKFYALLRYLQFQRKQMNNLRICILFCIIDNENFIQKSHLSIVSFHRGYPKMSQIPVLCELPQGLSKNVPNTSGVWAFTDYILWGSKLRKVTLRRVTSKVSDQSVHYVLCDTNFANKCFKSMDFVLFQKKKRKE